jgi:hypothetical protein
MKTTDVRRRSLVLRGLAVVLLIAGALMPIAGMSAGIGFPLIAIGISLVVIAQRNERRDKGRAA